MARKNPVATIGNDIRNLFDDLYSSFFSQEHCLPSPTTCPARAQNGAAPQPQGSPASHYSAFSGHPARPAPRSAFSLVQWTRSFAFAARGLNYPGYAFDGEETPERILDLLGQSFREWMCAPLPGRLYSLHVERHPLPEASQDGGESFFYTACCIDAEGAFMPIGAWIFGPGDGEACAHIACSLQQRGVQDVLFVCAQTDLRDRGYFTVFFPSALFAGNALQLLQPGAPRNKERDFVLFLCRGFGKGVKDSPQEEMRRAEAVCREVSPDWEALARDASSIIQNLCGRYAFGVRLILLPTPECIAQYRMPLAATLAAKFDQPATALLHYFSGFALKLWTRKLQTRSWSYVRPALAQIPLFKDRLDPLPPARDARAFFGVREA